MIGEIKIDAEDFVDYFNNIVVTGGDLVQDQEEDVGEIGLQILNDLYDFTYENNL